MADYYLVTYDNWQVSFMRKLLLTLLATFLIFSPTILNGQELGFKIMNDQKKVRIPFQLFNNLIVVPVILNNQLPLKFVLDTGVRTTILTEKAFSDILNLSYARKYTIAGVGGEKDQGVEAYITNGVSITLPGVRGLGHAMLVLEEDYLELRNYLGTEVHGILGYELFSRFVVKIDYDNKVLTLSTPEHFKPGRKYHEVPIEIQDTKPYIHGTLTYDKDPIDLKLMIDSGASHGLLIDPLSDSCLYIPENNIEANLGRGLGGELNGKISRLKSFEIGKRGWNNLLVTFPDSNIYLDSLKKTDVFRNGSIGGAILSRFKVIFDFPNEKIYLKKGSNYKKKFFYNMSGIVVKAKGSRLSTFEIVDIRENSSGALAGLKQGDIITSINNIPTARLELGNIVSMLNEKQNKRLRVEVRRGNENLKVVFRLKNQI